MYIKMTKFGYRVQLIGERHIQVKDEAKIVMQELTGMISFLKVKYVRSEKLRCCCFVPIQRNSIFDGLRRNLFKFIQESI